MSTIATSAQTADFLNELTPHLSHLSADEQGELLEELAIHLESVLDVAEAAGDGRSLRRIVGSPEDFIAEYCRSAQIPFGAATEPDGATVTSETDRDGPISRLLQGAMRLVEAAEEAVLGRNAWRSFIGFLPELAPAWWVARAVLVTMALGQVLGGDGVGHLGQIPVPKLFNSVPVGLAASIWLARKSVTIGRRQAGLGRVRIANVAIAAVSFLVLGTIAFASADTVYFQDITEVPESQQIDSFPDHSTSFDGHVLNLYPYDSSGQLLSDVRIFDQHGRPFLVRDGHPDLTNMNYFVPNLYPLDSTVDRSEGSIPTGPAPTIEPLGE